MLRCVLIPSPNHKQELLAQEVAEKSQFIVSDLESKFNLQNFYREQNNGLVGGAQVLRASEFWQKLLLQNDPAWQPLSPHLAQFLLQKWMSEILRRHSLKLSQKDCQRAYQTISQILPLLSHFQGEDVIDQWFAEHEEAKERWFEWYQMGRQLWSLLLERKIIPQDWMKGVLLNQELPSMESQRLVFDLGLVIDDVESELIMNLSRVVDVIVLVPVEDTEREAYSDLLSRCQPETLLKDQDVKVATLYRKLPTMLSEVKEATARVRRWLDQGVTPEQIAVLSPSIENYWPTLRQHLQVEGVPCRKGVATPLSQFPLFQTWLAKMRLSTNRLERGDGEQVIFHEEQEPEITFRQFGRLFSNVYDVSDYERDKNVNRVIPDPVSPESEMTFDEFLSWAFSLMPEKDWYELKSILSEFDDIYLLEESLSLRQWLDFFENYMASTERKVEPGQETGISVLPLNAASHGDFTHGLIVGLSESNLLDAKDTALSWTDIESIKINFGFNLPHSDRQQKVELLKWLMKKPWQEVVLSHSEADFAGQFQAPSLFWLQGAQTQGHDLQLESPELCRWDLLLQAKDLPAEPSSDETAHKVLRDLGQSSWSPQIIPELSLSASSLEEFFKCPYKLYAQKALKLGSDPELDYDIDYMSRGQLIHKICEIVIKENNFKLTDAELLDLIDKARTESDVMVYSDSVWNFLRPNYLAIARAFINFEATWREQFPDTQTIGFEEPMRTAMELSEKGFSFSDEGQIPFRGVIDRIDRNSNGEIVIIDYKSSDQSMTQYKSWLKNGRLQLALYSLALMEGVLKGEALEVVGAFYFGIKEMQRKKGFSISEASGSFLPSSKMTREERDSWLREVRGVVGELLEKIKVGERTPEPHDQKFCENCDWNTLCRAPHLNQ